MKCEKKWEKNDFVIPLTTRFTLGWVSCFLGNIATSEMWGGICLILHADLRFGITLEIVMLGFQAIALLNWPSSTSIKIYCNPIICVYWQGGFVMSNFFLHSSKHLFLVVMTIFYYYILTIDTWTTLLKEVY